MLMSGNEFFYTDGDGKRQDLALHARILDNPMADAATREASIERLMKSMGCTRAYAESIFTPPVTPKDYAG